MPTVSPTFTEQGFNQVWSVSRGIAAPAGLPKDVEAKLIGFLEKTLSSKEHQQKAEALSLEPSRVAAIYWWRTIVQPGQAGIQGLGPSKTTYNDDIIDGWCPPGSQFTPCVPPRKSQLEVIAPT